MSNGPGIWADERALKTLMSGVDEKLTSTQIAKRIAHVLGRPVTRNTICGKLARLGIRLGQQLRHEPKTYKAMRKKAPPRPKLIVGDEPLPAGDVDRGCRWMPGDDPRVRIFCGADLHNVSRYCPHHFSRAYREPDPAKERSFQKGAKAVKS